MKQHFLKAFLIVGVIAAGGVALVAANFNRIVPLLASEEGAYIDRLFGMQLYVIAFLFALVVGLMLYSVVAFRRRPGEEGDGMYFHGHTALEIVWTIVPLGIVLYFSALGARYFYEVKTANPDEFVVQVTGQQFSWSFYYPDYDITSSELVLPVGRQAVFQLTSKDVIHDFWVVEFRAKQDAVPGMVKELRLTPTQTGEFKVRCAELCGTGHADMRAPVRVVTQSEFMAWVENQKAVAGGLSGEALTGSQLAQELGCLGCHTVDGTEAIAPTWKGLFGSTETLADGSSVTVDEDYLRESILDPAAKLAEGFQPIMPGDYADKLSGDQIEALVEYIKTLK